jgi:septal ring factor EnvC (AmiA/AmiB activator)
VQHLIVIASALSSAPGDPIVASQITVPIMVVFSVGSAVVGAATAWALLVGRVAQLERQREEDRQARAGLEQRLTKSELEAVEAKATVRGLTDQHDKLREDLHSMERRILAAINETGASLRRELEAAGALRKPQR